MTAVPPSPNSQDHPVGELVAVPMKETERGTIPSVGVPVKSTEGIPTDTAWESDAFRQYGVPARSLAE